MQPFGGIEKDTAPDAIGNKAASGFRAGEQHRARAPRARRAEAFRRAKRWVLLAARRRIRCARSDLDLARGRLGARGQSADHQGTWRAARVSRMVAGYADEDRPSQDR